MKTGVKAIAGKGIVQAGVWETYTVVEWYTDTPMEQRNEALVKWQGYHIEEGRYDMILQKDQGNFRFLESGVGQEFLIVAYLNSPELNNASAIRVKIVSGENREILGIDMTDINDKPISGPLHYGQVVNVKIRTTGMVGEFLNIDMWEDDAKGAGHSEENKYNKVDSKMAKVGAKGVAEKQFTIKPNFAKIAEAHNKQEGSTHEYYFTVYAGEVSNASGNVNVYAPEYVKKRDTESQDEIAGTHPKVEPIKPVKKQPLAPPKKETPKTAEPKATPRPAPTPLKPATVKKEITAVYITDGAGKPISGTYKGAQLRVYVESTGLKDKEFRMKVYDEDMTGNDLILDKKDSFVADKLFVALNLSEIPRSKGGDYFYQNWFVDVEVLETKAHVLSKTVDVDVSVLKVDVPDNETKVKMGKEDTKDEKKSNCPNCDKDITLAEIKKICVDSKDKCLITDDAMITAALPHLNTYRKKVGINTCVRKAHFLAQIAHESNFQTLQEVFNWYWEPMIGTFKSYFKQFKTQAEKETEAKRLGRANKESKPGLTLDQQIKLANAIYGNTHPGGKLHTDANDGWRYSGKGFKQITWKGNYDALQKYFNKNMKVNGEADVVWVDGDNPYKLKNNAKDAMTSALAFWGMNGINGVATKISYESVTSVTSKINTGGDGLDERKRFFKKAVEILKTDECKPKEDLKLVVEKGTVIVMSGVLFKLGTEKTKAGKQWPVYKTSVYQNMSLETYKTRSSKGDLPAANYITYLTRDAQNKPTNGDRSTKRFGSLNEAPAGTYYLNKGIESQKYYVYLGDAQGLGESSISGSDGWRGGIAIHGGWPEGTEGCITTHTKNYGNKNAKKPEPINPLVQELIDNIPDFENNTDDKPVRFIIEERVATKSGKIWNGESI